MYIVYMTLVLTALCLLCIYHPGENVLKCSDRMTVR